MTHDTSILLHPVRILTRSVRRIAAMFKQPSGKLLDQTGLVVTWTSWREGGN